MRHRIRASGRGLVAILLLCACWLPGRAELRTTQASGDWNAPQTWGGTVPAAGDTAVIAPGHLVGFAESADVEDECARVEILPGAMLRP